jgi:tetratricopeptide (TPR) repeat protein
MKYADLLFLKGNFDESLEIVEDLLNEPGISNADIIELMRIKGHIYRFRQQFAEADIIYLEALKIAEEYGMLSYEGKLYTNLAENRCETSPSSSIEWFGKSKNINERSDNLIELGKAYAAVSVAYTNKADFGKAVECGEKAVALAESSGYRSGKVFALIALYRAYDGMNDQAKRKKIFSKIKKEVKELGVYQFLFDKVNERESLISKDS